ncbi:MAG: hypothetical protein JSV63_01850 [Candidatus Aenigmatarchaeota archaeon]|nr:MAG: hypothetical protein JSV63_01850 [Candidatus Aenigmarchaeota archaeon]
MEISNNVLAVLVLLAMVFSLVGTTTMLSLAPGAPFTGLAASPYEIGTAQVTVESEIAIELVRDTINFGTIDNTPGSQNLTDDLDPPPFVLRNNGSERINVSIAESTGNQLWDEDDTAEDNFRFNATRNGTTTGYDWAATWASFRVENMAENASAADINLTYNGGVANLVANLSTSSGGAARDINVHLNITVPNGEEAGAKTGTIFFKAGAA